MPPDCSITAPEAVRVGEAVWLDGKKFNGDRKVAVRVASGGVEFTVQANGGGNFGVGEVESRQQPTPQAGVIGDLQLRPMTPGVIEITASDGEDEAQATVRVWQG